VPVISAVGHEVDFTIADFVADVRAATPSNAAEIVVDRADNFRTRIERAEHRLGAVMALAIGRNRQRSDRALSQLRRWPTTVMLQRRDCHQWQLRLTHAMKERLKRSAQQFDASHRRLERRDVRRVVGELSMRLGRADGQLRSAVRTHRAGAESISRELAGRLHALSPLAVLGRGYAVCWNEDRTAIIRSARSVEPGDGVRVTLAEGELACHVAEIKEDGRARSES